LRPGWNRFRHRHRGYLVSFPRPCAEGGWAMNCFLAFSAGYFLGAVIVGAVFLFVLMEGKKT
jgi:hypothetical protein